MFLKQAHYPIFSDVVKGELPFNSMITTLSDLFLSKFTAPNNT
jgi:hypothetical protein